MFRFKSQRRRRSVTVLTLMFALCATGIVPATATTATNTSLPVIASVQINLPGPDKITINGTGFGTARPNVSMGGTPLVVSDGFTNTKVVANLPTPLPAAGDYLLVVTNTSTRLIAVLTVTIGGVGSPGPQGAPGPKGDEGGTGATGATGPQGPAGAQGPQGERGASGPQGQAGADGVSPVGQPEPAGTNCQHGGLKYTDAQGVHYICNGAPGAGNTAALDARLRALERATFPIAYVANSGSDTVSMIDPAINAVIKTIAVGNGPVSVAVNPPAPRLYVANRISGTVSVIDAEINTIVTNITVGIGPTFVAVNPSGTRAYVANKISNTVSVIDTETNTVVANITVGNAPLCVAISPAGTRAYVANEDSNTVSVIDTLSNTVITDIPATQPTGVAITPSGTHAYVTDQEGFVRVIDTASNTPVKTIGVGLSPVAVIFNPSGTRAYVTIAGGVRVIDAVSNSSSVNILVPAPTYVAVNPSGTRAYVTNSTGSSGPVSVIDLETNTVVANIAVGSAPMSIAFR